MSEAFSISVRRGISRQVTVQAWLKPMLRSETAFAAFCQPFQ